jgi:hypothetical protein
MAWASWFTPTILGSECTIHLCVSTTYLPRSPSDTDQMGKCSP